MSPALRLVAPLLLCSTLAAAQDFELDLSGKPGTEELELDLTEKKPVTPPEYRPKLAVLGVKGAAGEEVSASRARQLEAELLKELAQGDLYQTVVEPSSARTQLGAEFARAETCADYACMESIAKALKVHRVVRLTVQKQGAGSLVTMYGYDPGFNEVLVVAQDSAEKAEKSFLGVAGKSQAQKDKEFMKKLSGFLAQVQKALSIPNGKIVVDNADPSAVVKVDGVESGVGSLDIYAQRGTRNVKVTAAGYLPFEQAVTVKPGEASELKVTLVAIPLEPEVVVKPVEAPKVSFFARPGLYLAVAGAIAAGVGVALGQSAQSVKDRLAAGGDPVNVTRAAAKQAPTDALMANVLVGAGAAAVVGGVTWIILTPSGGPPPPPAVKTGTGEPVESTTPGPSGLMLQLGGSF